MKKIFVLLFFVLLTSHSFATKRTASFSLNKSYNNLSNSRLATVEMFNNDLNEEFNEEDFANKIVEKEQISNHAKSIVFDSNSKISRKSKRGGLFCKCKNLTIAGIFKVSDCTTGGDCME